MKTEDIEPRWLDPSSDADDELRELLRLTGDDDPSADELARLDARLGPLLKPAFQTALPKGDRASIGKVATGIGVLAVGAGIAWLALSPGSARLAADDPELPVSAPARTETLPLLASEGRSLPSARAPVASERPTRVRTPSIPSDEMELLQKAQLALGAGNASGALELTREHARSFPKSALGQEREVIAIEALARLGRRSEALARGKRFIQQFPESAHARRVRAILGLEADGGTP